MEPTTREQTPLDSHIVKPGARMTLCGRTIIRDTAWTGIRSGI